MEFFSLSTRQPEFKLAGLVLGFPRLPYVGISLILPIPFAVMAKLEVDVQTWMELSQSAVVGVKHVPHETDACHPVPVIEPSEKNCNVRHCPEELIIGGIVLPE